MLTCGALHTRIIHAIILLEFRYDFGELVLRQDEPLLVRIHAVINQRLARGVLREIQYTLDCWVRRLVEGRHGQAR